MARRSAQPVAVRLDRASGQPLAAQLAGQVRAGIQSGLLASGSRLPSTRALAAELRVARGVVEQAFDQLSAEGWIAGARGSGTFVSAGVEPAAAPAHSQPRPTPGPRAQPGTLIRLDSGTPWVDRSHRAGWRRAWRNVAMSEIPAQYPDPAGLPALRAEIAAHVAAHRGVACTPEQVLITSGSTHGLSLLLDVIGPGAVAVEDPGYRAAVAVSAHAGREVVDVPVDGEGIAVAGLRAMRRSDIRSIYVTPAHQHPLGITMSAPRRMALIAEAARRAALIVEDDYDSEFRYDVAPLPALAQLGLDHVAYVGTAAKVIVPGLRLGWLVTSAERVAEMAARRAVRHDHPSWPTQRALVTMLQEGHVTRLVRSARRTYSERSERMRSVLERHGELTGDPAGMYLTVALDGAHASAVAERALVLGIEVPLLADYCRTAQRTGLVVGFGGLTDQEFAHVLGVLRRELASTTGRR